MGSVTRRRAITMSAAVLVALAVWYVAIRDRASADQVRATAIAATSDRTMVCHVQNPESSLWFCVSRSGVDACVRVTVSITGSIRVGRLQAICENP